MRLCVGGVSQSGCRFSIHNNCDRLGLFLGDICDIFTQLLGCKLLSVLPKSYQSSSAPQCLTQTHLQPGWSCFAASEAPLMSVRRQEVASTRCKKPSTWSGAEDGKNRKVQDHKQEACSNLSSASARRHATISASLNPRVAQESGRGGGAKPRTNTW